MPTATGPCRLSRALADLGAEYLAVSNLEEAVQIRRGEVRLPILILGYTPPGVRREYDLPRYHAGGTFA